MYLKRRPTKSVEITHTLMTKQTKPWCTEKLNYTADKLIMYLKETKAVMSCCMIRLPVVLCWLTNHYFFRPVH